MAIYSLALIQKELQIPVIFKASFDKANRQDLSRYICPYHCSTGGVVYE